MNGQVHEFVFKEIYFNAIVFSIKLFEGFC